MNALRLRLREITENAPADDHPRLIEDLRRVHARTIELVVARARIERYTCAVHALDLIENREYEKIVWAAQGDVVFASTGFVQRLIDRELLVKADLPGPGRLVVYRDGDLVTHIGKTLSPERVESKWGIGQRWRHGLWEVPSQYGCDVEFFDAIDTDTVLDEMVEFAKENGVSFEE